MSTRTNASEANAPPHTRATERKKVKLQEFYNSKIHCSDTDMDTKSNFVLQVLRDAPQLASHEFRHVHSINNVGNLQTRWHPFVHMLHAGSSLEVLKEIYFMFPGVLSEMILDHGRLRIVSPLIIACQFRKDEADLIRFIAEAAPHLMTTSTYNPEVDIEIEYIKGHLPIHEAIVNLASYETLKTLLELCPESVLYQSPKMKLTNIRCFDIAVVTYGHFSEDPRINLITETIGRSTQSLEFRDFHTSIIRQLGLLTSLLEKCKTFTLQCHSAYTAAASNFLHGIRSHKTITKLKIDCRESRWEQLEGFHHVLKRFIRRNTVLLDLHIAFSDNCTNTRARRMTPCLESIQQGLSANKTLTHLCLEGLWLDSTRGVGDLFASQSLTWLELEHCHINMGLWSCPMSGAKHASLQEVRFLGVSLPAACITGLLPFLGEMPLLTSVVLRLNSDHKSDDDGDHDFTEALVQLLRKNRLQRLDVTNMHLDFKSLCGALRYTTELSRFGCDKISVEHSDVLLDLFERYNTTLLRMSNGERGPVELPNDIQKKIDYFSKMNLYGRGGSRDCKYLAELIDIMSSPLLRDFEAVEVDEEDNWHEYPLNLFNIHFCLLAQCPILWSRNQLTKIPRKRKREDTWQQLVSHTD